ncbi:hypothetical protein KAR91_60605, partial [Candidatus Pacearchaeota archaeon]|nr:hypothetical protein [Candidatus Pacearchaeota archaeon]
MLLLLNDFEKGFVRQHTRKSGTVVQSHFTKRPPGKVQEKHLKERFYDHDKSSAKKAHEELETKKAHHQSVLSAVKKHHDELTKQGPEKDEKGVTHKTKIEHLKAEIKNQETHIDNHSRKQKHIKNRYEISSKQIVRKKSKADLEKRIKDHSDEQKNTIRNIHKAHQEGRSNLEPGKVLTGKDKDHIYLKTKHKETGKTHHIAIHKDGSVKDPQILHGGKFDHKTLEEQREEKKVVVKKPTEKLDPQVEVKMAMGMSKKEAIEAVESEAKTRAKAPKIKTLSQKIKERDADKGPVRVGTMTESGEVAKVVPGAIVGKKEPEKPKREPKKVVVKRETSKPKTEEPKKVSVKEKPKKTVSKKITKVENEALNKWISEEGNQEMAKLLKSGKKSRLINDFERAVEKLSEYNGIVYRGLSNLDKKTFEKIMNSSHMDIPYYSSASTKKEIAQSFMKSKMKKGVESYGVVFKIHSKTGKDLETYEGEIVLQPNVKYKIKKVGEVKPYIYKTRLLGGKLSSNITDKKRKVVEIEVEEVQASLSKKSEVEEKENRSKAMMGNKNAFKGGPKEEPKKATVKKQDIAAFTRTKKELDGAQEKARTGKETMVITARSKDKHKVRYKVIEADDDKLMASNHIDGKINKDYPSLDVKGALQMRDRSNIQSKAQINQMSNDLEPMFLTDSKIASDGAPIVGSDYKGKEDHSVVESGNGRVMAIRTAYENGKAGHYKDHLVDEAESFGIDPGTIKGMKNPILIRERIDKMSDEEKAKFAKESNKATVSQMTAVEQAIEDSNYLGQLSNLKATDSGRITHKNNSQFIKDFFSQVMDNDPREVGKLLNKDGQLNDEGERRLTNAVFTRVYGSHSDIMNKLI